MPNSPVSPREYSDMLYETGSELEEALVWDYIVQAAKRQDGEAVYGFLDLLYTRF